MEAKWKLNLTDPAELIRSIFKHGPDLLVPVIFEPQMCGAENLRDLAGELELQGKMLNMFVSVIAVQVLGQYSMHRAPFWTLVRMDGYFREAMPEEVTHDFQNFGEQVMGEKITNVNKDGKHRATVYFFGDLYEYTGPARTEKIITVLRSAPGIPNRETIIEFARQVDESSLPAENEQEKSHPLYYLITADKGNVMIGRFAKVDDISAERLQYLGKMEIQGEKMFFFPEGDRDNPIDFTEGMLK